MPINKFYKERRPGAAAALRYDFYDAPRLTGAFLCVFAADVVAAFISIALWSELIIDVWYLPMEALDVTGYEPLVLMYLCGAAYGYIEALRRTADRRVALLRALATVCGVLSFHVRSSHLLRLAALCFGLFYDQLAAAACLFNAQRHARQRWVAAYAVAFQLTFIVRLAYASVHPLFVFERVNTAVACLGFAGAAALATYGGAAAAAAAAARTDNEDNTGEDDLDEAAGNGTEIRTATSAVQSRATNNHHSNSTNKHTNGGAATDTAAAAQSPSSLYVALAYGCTLFLMHFLFASHSVVARWSGIATNSAVALQGTALVVWCGAAAGLALSQQRIGGEVVASRVWLQLCAAALAAFYLFAAAAHYVHYAFAALAVLAAGGLATCTFALFVLCACDFGALPAAARGRAFLVAAGAYTALLIVSIYVVAYKFCPGGWLLRERHSAIFALVGLAWWAYYSKRLFLAQNLTKSGSTKRATDFYDDDEENAGASFHRQPSSSSAAAAAGAPSARQVASLSTMPPSLFVLCKRCVVLSFLALLLPTAAYRFYRLASVAPEPKAHGVADELHTGIWTIHFGYDNYGRNSFEKIIDVLRKERLDVVGFLESDLTRPYYGNIDLIEYIGEQLQMHAYYGPSTATNTWGCGLLSAYPIQSAEPVLLPSPEGELACLVDAVLLLDGDRPVRVLVSHFGNTEDALDRRLQSEWVAQRARAAAAAREPLVVLAYLTAEPRGANMQRMLDAGLRDPAAEQHAAARRFLAEHSFYRDEEDVAAMPAAPRVEGAPYLSKDMFRLLATYRAAVALTAFSFFEDNRYCQYVLYSPGGLLEIVANYNDNRDRSISDTALMVGNFKIKGDS